MKKPILLLSGPSGSGKTTTAQRMEAMLDSRGVQTHTISLDCYFTTLSPEEVKKVDLESPERLDKALLEEMLFNAYTVRERYTVLSLMKEMDLMKEVVPMLVEKYL